MHDTDTDTVEANIRTAEVSLASNVYPRGTVVEARTALRAAQDARLRGDVATALAASEIALRLLADALS
ncbi:hypothetical protein AMK16_20910 [Streptomyces sp. CB00455]|uniref:hypothetical protein n=1 Tax=Streptomyces sp. CB00455 TaxID=1703927 RepID=UPI00093E55EF|nr:hypothetical protein [Streptomyces sp. CB00455]OKK17323.1 hypothetical protein AMK16_20910 [Streptomyces sp. CB00455]